MTSTVQHKALVRQYVDGVFGRGDLSVIEEVATADVAQRLRRTLEALPLLRAFRRRRVSILELFAQDDVVVCQASWNGVHAAPFMDIAPTGRPVTVPLTALFRVGTGRIEDVHQIWDTYEVRRQLGAGPGPVLEPRSPAAPPPQREPVLNLQEIQGNVVPGFNKDHQYFLFLEMGDVEAARDWLRAITPHVATADEALAFKQLFTATRERRGGRAGTVQSTWINIALSCPGLKKLSDDADQFVDSAFKAGQHERADVLGDPVDDEAAGSSTNWVIGGPHNVPDVVVLLASDNRDDLLDEVGWVKAGLGRGLRLLYETEGATQPPPLRAHEHFGFYDGISQPGLRGRVSTAPGDFVTARQNPADPDQGKPGQNLVWPGEFIFGYPGQDPHDRRAPGPEVHAGPPWAKNGSYLVFRRYVQDVEAFEHFLQSTAAELAEREPALAGMTPKLLGAKFVGRWTSGAPLSRAPKADDPELARNRCANNNFAFRTASQPVPDVGGDHCSDSQFPPAPADAQGLRCPHAAHIRKAYPRDEPLAGAGAHVVEKHRILRRGIPFEMRADTSKERGLLFLAYMTSIEQQFEFVVRNWFNNPDFGDRGAGYDPLVGQAGGGQPRTLTLPVSEKNGNVEKISLALPLEWVTTTGGAYLFAPSISALHYLGLR